MRIIVNDTSCLIDMRKTGLLHAALLLPFQFQVALPLVSTELLDFTAADIHDLEARGLAIVDLPPDGVRRALELRGLHSVLSFNDCLSLALAEAYGDAILLTGDRNLLRRAEGIGIEVHGVLWITDHLENGGSVAFQTLLDALLAMQADPLVHLPTAALDERIVRLKRKLGRP